MIFGRDDAYLVCVTYIQQHVPLPTFATEKSRLELKESIMLQSVTRESDSSSMPADLVADTISPISITPH